MDELELDKLAREEILREAHRASARADEVGPQGWMKCPVPPANKRFLRNTLLSTLPNKSEDVSDSHRSAEPKSGETKSKHRSENRQKPNSGKGESTNKRHHSKDRSKSPKDSKVDSRGHKRTKSNRGDTRKTP